MMVYVYDKKNNLKEIYMKEKCKPNDSTNNSYRYFTNLHLNIRLFSQAPDLLDYYSFSH